MWSSLFFLFLFFESQSRVKSQNNWNETKKKKQLTSLTSVKHFESSCSSFCLLFGLMNRPTLLGLERNLKWQSLETYDETIWTVTSGMEMEENSLKTCTINYQRFHLKNLSLCLFTFFIWNICRKKKKLLISHWICFIKWLPWFLRNNQLVQF